MSPWIDKLLHGKGACQVQLQEGTKGAHTAGLHHSLPIRPCVLQPGQGLHGDLDQQTGMLKG
eukprot:2998357-Prorocentrum_lima.AAC.1